MDRNNTTAFIEAQQYSNFILENLHDVLLPGSMFRNVSDFNTGTVLDIKTVGSTAIQDVQEGQPLDASDISTNTIKLYITDYIGDAWKISDELRQDGTQLEQLQAMRAMEATRAIAENFETRFLQACNAGQTAGAANTVNGQAHRVASSETDNLVTLDHFIQMKLAFDKANVPQAGRIAIVDPVVEATINGLTNLVNVSNNPMFEGMVTEGFAKDHKFVRNIFGWDIWTSNRLPKGTLGDGTTSVTDGVANVFMSVLDDNTKPIMGAWRKMPSVEGWREPSLREDHFATTGRFGFGTQRNDSLGILISDATKY